MKKKRGLKRYFKTLKTKDLFQGHPFINDNYLSYTKVWADDYGMGDFSLKKRILHLDCLIRNYTTFVDTLSSKYLEFQIWIWIDESYSREDCIFMHSQNPFNEFPHKYTMYSLESNFRNKDLVNYLNNQKGFSKIYGIYFEEEDTEKLEPKKFCVMYKEDVGVSVI